MTEDQHTERRSSWRDEYLMWLCGFANAQGGVLEIGRDDKGQVVGADEAERLMEEQPNKLRDLLGIVVDMDLLGITPDGIKYHLGRLREAGRVRHVGPTKKGHWEILEDGP